MSILIQIFSYRFKSLFMFFSTKFDSVIERIYRENIFYIAVQISTGSEFFGKFQLDNVMRIVVCAQCAPNHLPYIYIELRAKQSFRKNCFYSPLMKSTAISKP